MKNGFISFSGRHFNEDPIENYFSQIGNVNPTCSNFNSYYKKVYLFILLHNILKKKVIVSKLLFKIHL